MKNPGCKGQSLVESSLILAAFMTLLLGMVLTGQSLFVRQTLAERVQEAARWGALNPYNPESIRNLVLYGTAKPESGAKPFVSLSSSEIVVSNPGCPEAQCRIMVAIPAQGIRSTEPVEYLQAATDGVPSRP